jgi:hypothetical protein
MERIIEKVYEGTNEIKVLLVKKARSVIRMFESSTSVSVPFIRDVCFCAIPELGHYEWGSQYIVLSNTLLQPDISMEFTLSVMLHELAHYLCFCYFGTNDGHGKQFHLICDMIGAPPEFSKARINIDLAEDTGSRLTKIKKLLALSESNNVNESRVALAKARKMMSDSGLSTVSDEEAMYSALKDSMKRVSTRHHVLNHLSNKISGAYSVNETQWDGTHSFRVFGSKTQVEVDCYIYDYLSSILESEYKRLRQQGIIHDRGLESFYTGVEREMNKRFEETVESHHTDNAMVLIQAKNKDDTYRYYSHTGLRKMTRKGHRLNKDAFVAGKKVGRTTQIRQGLGTSQSKEKKYLT